MLDDCMSRGDAKDQEKKEEENKTCSEKTKKENTKTMEMKQRQIDNGKSTKRIQKAGKE